MTLSSLDSDLDFLGISGPDLYERDSQELYIGYRRKAIACDSDYIMNYTCSHAFGATSLYYLCCVACFIFTLQLIVSYCTGEAFNYY